MLTCINPLPLPAFRNTDTHERGREGKALLHFVEDLRRNRTPYLVSPLIYRNNGHAIDIHLSEEDLKEGRTGIERIYYNWSSSHCNGILKELTGRALRNNIFPTACLLFHDCRR